jgi:hypothetical protein
MKLRALVMLATTLVLHLFAPTARTHAQDRVCITILTRELTTGNTVCCLAFGFLNKHSRCVEVRRAFTIGAAPGFKRLEERNSDLSSAISPGDSGGPFILKDRVLMTNGT